MTSQFTTTKSNSFQFLDALLVSSHNCTPILKNHQQAIYVRVRKIVGKVHSVKKLPTTSSMGNNQVLPPLKACNVHFSHRPPPRPLISRNQGS